MGRNPPLSWFVAMQNKPTAKPAAHREPCSVQQRTQCEWPLFWHTICHVTFCVCLYGAEIAILAACDRSSILIFQLINTITIITIMLARSFTYGRRLALTSACHISRVRPQNHQQNLVLKASHFRCLSSTPMRFKRLGPFDPEESFPPKRKNFRESILPDDWMKLIERYPEFLPDPISNTPFLVSRMMDDMLKRRAVIEIPEFYVGSILAVTVSDRYSETKKSRFVGICINRTGQLTYASFTLRNVIDGMGCEIRYDLYNPLILSIEVLKLEKRLDDSLIYLCDALPEYSTVPEDMKPVAIEPGAEVPVNKTLVKMKEFPWSRHWECWLFKGIECLENVPEFFAAKARALEENPVYSYDLMLEYRRHCTEELMYNICKRLMEHEKNVVEVRREAKAKRFIRMGTGSAPKVSTS